MAKATGSAGYDLKDQSNVMGGRAGQFDRLFGGMTREQDANLKERAEGRLGFNAKNILNQVNKGNVTGYVQRPDGTIGGVRHIDTSPMGRGLSKIMGFLGNENFVPETYTGDPMLNPYMSDQQRMDMMGLGASEPPPPTQNPLTGEVLIRDYRLVDAPALAQLVGEMTLARLKEALQGDGLAFS